MMLSRACFRPFFQAACLGLACGVSIAAPPWQEDWETERRQLSEQGLAWQLNYTGSFMNHTGGGFRHGTNGQGLLDFAVMVDLEKMAGWKGGTFHAEVIWVTGGSPSSVD